MLVIAASLMLAPAAAFAATANTAPTTAVTAAAALPASNPFAQASSLPFHYPPFDKVQDADYAPAFTAGMAANLAEIKAIANNKKPATFDNTIVAMERSGQLLSRVRTVFSVMSGSNTNETIQGLERELAPKMAAHSDAVMLNDKLFKRIDSLYAKPDGNLKGMRVSLLAADGVSLKSVEEICSALHKEGVHPQILAPHMGSVNTEEGKDLLVDGTLSGNPLAMAAGLTTLRLISRPGFHAELSDYTTRLLDGLQQRADAAGIPFVTTQAGGMFGLYFSGADDIVTFDDVMASDAALFGRFFHLMLEGGVYLAPSAFEAGFTSIAHGETELKLTLDAAERAFAALK